MFGATMPLNMAAVRVHACVYRGPAGGNHVVTVSNSTALYDFAIALVRLR
jgi:hypothetical protein